MNGSAYLNLAGPYGPAAVEVAELLGGIGENVQPGGETCDGRLSMQAPVVVALPVPTLKPGELCDVCHQPATRLVKVEDEPFPLALCDACPTESEIAATCAEIRSTWSVAERRRRRSMSDCGRPTTKQKTLDAQEAALHGARRALRRLTEHRVAASRESA